MRLVGSDAKGYDLEIKERGEAFPRSATTINLARSLLHDPTILLLDEPTSSMDQATETAAINSLQEFQRKTMVLVTPKPHFKMVDRVFVIENGKIIADKTSTQLGIKKVDSK